MADLTGEIIVTTAGRNALLGGSFAPAELALGTASWTPTETSTALNTEVSRVDVAGVVDQIGDDARLHLTALDDSSLDYDLREFALFDDDGVCLAIYSQATDIAVKATASQLLLTLDLVIQDADVGSIDVGDTTYNLPAATTSASGLVELATTAEAQAGVDAVRAITPAALASVTATESRRGLVELATSSEVQAGADTDRAVTPAGLAALTSTQTRAGLIERANAAEVEAGTDDERAITPLTLLARTATLVRAGLARLATAAETIAGSLATVAVTPAGLAALTSSDTRRGLVELATTEETLTGADTQRAVTPAGAKAADDRLRPRHNNRHSTVLYDPEQTINELTFSGLVANGFYVVLVIGRGRGVGGSVNVELVGATGAASPVESTSSPFALQGRLQANGSGQLAVQLRNAHATRDLEIEWASVSATLAA
jgi:hypothetical protein